MRTVLEVHGFDLNAKGRREVAAVPHAAAGRVTVALESGAWGSAVVTVKRCAGGVRADFATPKSLAADGSVELTPAELNAVGEIEVRVGTAAGAAGYARVVVELEEDAAI